MARWSSQSGERVVNRHVIIVIIGHECIATVKLLACAKLVHLDSLDELFELVELCGGLRLGVKCCECGRERESL